MYLSMELLTAPMNSGKVVGRGVVQDDAVVFGEVFQRLAVFVDAIGHGAHQRGVGGDFHRALVFGRDAVPDVLVDVEVGVHHDLVESLQIVVLQHFLESEDAVGLGAAPFGGVNGSLFQGGEDVTRAHGHGGHADVVVGLAGDAGRRAKAVFAEVVHAVDGLLEPAEGFGPDGLEHQPLDIHAHFVPQLVVELASAAEHKPGDPGDVVDAESGAGGGGAEEGCGGVLARPVVGPGEAALHQPFVDGVQRFAGADDGAGGQDFDLHFAVGEGEDVGGVILEHDDFVGVVGDDGLDVDDGLGERRSGGGGQG